MLSSVFICPVMPVCNFFVFSKLLPHLVLAFAMHSFSDSCITFLFGISCRFLYMYMQAEKMVFRE